MEIVGLNISKAIANMFSFCQYTISYNCNFLSHLKLATIYVDSIAQCRNLCNAYYQHDLAEHPGCHRDVIKQGRI